MTMVVALATLAQANLQGKIDALLPTPLEVKWLSIPWRTNLSAARTDAQRENKPIFMWIMNGHPMGCT